MVEEEKDVKIPVGYFKFHEDEGLNFQLNFRLYTTGLFSKKELFKIGEEIQDYNEVTPLMEKLAKESIEKKELRRATAYMRLAEFFCFSSEDEKRELREEYISLFYQAYAKENIKNHEVPYENGKLPVFEIFPKGKIKDTLVMHGGGDSFMEDLYQFVKPFADSGYHIIFFEGPGQGGALHKFNLKMTHEWEKPVSAIYDFFKLDQVPLIGISLGGYFACRAAAYEKRISRVVFWDVVYDFFECVFGRESKMKSFFLKTLVDINASKIINKMVEKKMKKEPFLKWIMEHSYFIHGVETPFQYLKRLKKYTTADISHLVTIPTLVLAGTNDHIIPFRMYKKQMNALKNVEDLTGRVFTKEEHAASHGQVGNIPLVVKTITDWLDKK
jgi:pimeloyl-ACP methyl ester carboxylesterase